MCACVCTPSSVFLHMPECVSALLDVSLSTDKYSQTRDRQTQEYIYKHAADRHDLSWHNDLLFQNLPSQLMKSPG